VHGHDVAARAQRADADAEHPIQVRVVEVVQELGEHDEVERVRRPLSGNGSLLDLHA
jgi:hypothetical protein